MIRVSVDFGVNAHRVADRHGIWVDAPSGEEKLAALGVHLSRWVTSHGFAYNVATDLRYFDLIVPCGIAGKRATSLERVLECAVSSAEVTPRLLSHFGEVFGCEMVAVPRVTLEEKLADHAAAAQRLHQNTAERVAEAEAAAAAEAVDLQGSRA